jgi:NaMN:DMB phosphoribosyltransferase
VVVREGVGAGGEMNQALYAHMNNKRKMKNK